MHYSIRCERPCAAPPEIVYDLLIDVKRWPDRLSELRSAVWAEAGIRGGPRGSHPPKHAYTQESYQIPAGAIFGLAAAGGSNGGSNSVPSRLCTGSRCDHG